MSLNHYSHMKLNKYNKQTVLLEDDLSPWGQETHQQPIKLFRRTGSEINKNAKNLSSLSKKQFNNTTPRLYPKKEKVGDDQKSIVKTLSLTFHPEFIRHKNLAENKINLLTNRSNHQPLNEVQNELKKYKTISNLQTLPSWKMPDQSILSPEGKTSKREMIFNRQRFFRSLNDRNNKKSMRETKFRDMLSIMRITLKKSEKQQKIQRKAEREYFKSIWKDRQLII